MKTLTCLLALPLCAMAQPSVTAVIDGAAFTINIAQGSVFVVKGTGLSPAGFVSANAPDYPTILNGVRITLTPGSVVGSATPALMVNTFNQNGVNQLVAVLPSGTPLGVYDLRVENAGTASAPFRVNVVARKPGIVTASSDGKGIAQATLEGKLILDRPANAGKIGDFDTRSAHPGERVDLWGTGLGPDPASDTGGTSGDQTKSGQIVVTVNGAEVTPLYAGRSQGYPGLDQIVFLLPNNAPTSCTVDVQVRAGGVLSNLVTLATATGDACPTDTVVRINEVESNGGVPGDWVELFNPGSTPANLAGYIFRDNDDTHKYTLPSTAVVPAGGYYMLEEADFGFGLGSPDAARLFRPDGSLADSYWWTPHAATTYGRCPNASGAMVTTTSSTKGALNDCSTTVRINEIQSGIGVPGDWVELYNTGATAVDLSGFVFRDNDDAHTYVIPFATSVSAGGFAVLDATSFGFSLGTSDSVRLFDPNGVLVDSYTWTSRSAVTYGRCPDGTGAFTNTTAPTKFAANACPGAVSFDAWPGSSDIQIVDGMNVFGGNLSGLIYEPSGSGAFGTLWAVRNGPGTLYRLLWNGSIWTPDTANNWGSGKAVRYPNGSGDPDAEGVTFTTGPTAGMYVSTERDNNVNTISRPAVLRFDISAAGATLTATNDWNLTSDLPVVGANLGLEGITWIPDTFLVSKGFIDESKGRAYNPADYPNHGTGLFFVGVEANGMVYGYALDHMTNGFTRVATINPGLGAVMELQFDRDANDLWAVCDDTCQGRSVILRIDTTGKFTVVRRFERPAGMPNLNNEGFAIAPAALCVFGRKPVYWSDDSETGGHSIRSGSLSCTPL